MPKTFTEIRKGRCAEIVEVDQILDDEKLTENFLRKGAALAFGSRSKAHGDKVIGHANQSNQKLNFGLRKDLDASQKLDLLADALILQNHAIIELRKQIGASVSVAVSTALFLEKQSGKRR